MKGNNNNQPKFDKQELEDFKDFTREKLYIENALPTEIKWNSIERIASKALTAGLYSFGMIMIYKILKWGFTDDKKKPNKTIIINNSPQQINYDEDGDEEDDYTDEAND